MSEGDKVIELLASREVIPHAHQIDGMEWCVERQDEEGGIFGDPMGLGKTLLSLMVILRIPKNRTLIVVPLPLLEQWVTAVQKILGHEPCVFHSSRGTTKVDKGWLESKDAHVFITTYNLLSRKGVLHEIAWDRVMYDEAHTLRNSATKGFKAAASLQTGSQFFITGTPIQNQTADIESLLSLLHEPVTQTDAHLKEQIGKHMLRRTKESVGMALPPLYITDIEVPWASLEEQRRATGIHSSLGFSNVELSKEDSKPYKKMGEYNRLALMTRAKQACTSSDLLLPFIKELNEQEKHTVPTSSKFAALIAYVKERLANKKNKVIFSSFRGELDNIVEALRTPEVRVAAIDGRTPAAERQLILSETYDVLVMQLNTGSVGLNLQQYSEVYFVNPGWNPATEQQAIARCHRQGQTEAVYVFRFVMSGFTEAELKQKQKMEEAAAEEAAAAVAHASFLSSLTREERASVEAAEEEAAAAAAASSKKRKASGSEAVPSDWRSSTIDMYARSKQQGKLALAEKFIGGSVAATPLL